MILEHRAEADRSQGFLVNCLQIAGRRKIAIGLPIIIGLVAAFVLSAASVPRYSADAVIALDARKIQVIDINSVVSRLPEESAALRTELDAIASRSMANLVADRLRFEERPDLLAALRVESPLAVSLRRWRAEALDAANALRTVGFIRGTGLDGLIGSVKEALSPPRAQPAMTETPDRGTIVDWLLDGLRVSNDGRSFTIYVTFSSPDPLLSAEISNAFTATYLEDLVGMKVRAAKGASTWLRKRLDEMRHELEVSETAVFQFRRAAGLMEFRGDTIVGQQISELNSQLGVARAERGRIESKLQDALASGKSAASSADRMSEVGASPLIQALRRDIGNNEAKLADLRDRGAFRHPDTIALESRQVALQRQLATETQRVVEGLKEDAASARRQEGELQSNLQAMATRFGRTGEAAVRLNQLEREAGANRAIYESFLSRYKETIEQEGLTLPEARLLSLAEPPAQPAGSGGLPFLILGLLSGGLVGAVCAVIRERMDERIYDLADVERLASAPVVGVLPNVSRWQPMSELQIARPVRSAFAEAIQRTNAALRLPGVSGRGRVIMVTSAFPAAGKTSFCAALARSLALSHRRVLVIDADLRQPRIAKTFGLRARPDTQDVAREKLALADGIRIDEGSGVHVLTAAPEGGALPAVLQGEGWRALVDRARADYDVVILDTPPVMAASDAGIIGASADVNLFLVRWGRSSRSGLGASIRFLNLCGLTINGVVVTRTKSRRPPRYLAPYGQGPGGMAPYPADQPLLRGPTATPA